MIKVRQYLSMSASYVGCALSFVRSNPAGAGGRFTDSLIVPIGGSEVVRFTDSQYPPEIDSEIVK